MFLYAHPPKIFTFFFLPEKIMTTDEDKYQDPPFNFPTKANKSKLYAILGISSNASQSEIKSAFREKAKKLHPDIIQNSKSDTDSFGKEEQNAKFLELKNAYEQLTGQSDGDAEEQKGPIFGPGMRARMDAAKKMREKHGQTGGRIQAAREWSENSSREKKQEDHERAETSRSARFGEEEEELSAAEILFRARQKRGKVSSSSTFGGGGRRRQQQHPKARRANTTVGGSVVSNAAASLKAPLRSKRGGNGNLRVKVLAAIAVAGAVFLTANRRAKRREENVSEH
jgi:DnaJ-class molecular chaperone